MFLENFSDLEFCIKINTTTVHIDRSSTPSVERLTSTISSLRNTDGVTALGAHSDIMKYDYVDLCNCLRYNERILGMFIYREEGLILIDTNVIL